ncbi:MAG: hypothetical protein DRO89_05575 [Candidatus Altiarchaeales archaeon]|nr:MAG: hypothetical protein DRO89_05575 [Candidatus Altiarchaeales archaeon]
MHKLKLTPEERWDYLDKLAEEVVTLKPRRLSLKDAIGDLTIRPLTGIPIALGILFSVWMFFSTFAGFFTDGFMVPLFDEHYLPWIQDIFPKEPSWLYALLVGTPGADNCFEAFGVLTTGLFVPFGVVLWAIIPLYLSVALLEDIGYLPRLAVLVDNILHRIGLHGFAIVPTILSFGCNIPGVTAARILETKKERFMMMTILAIFIPCGAQLGIMEETIAGEYGNWLMFAIIGYLLLGYFVVGWILNKILPGRSPEILIDIPPYQRPIWKNLTMKTWIRVKCFLVHAVPFVILGSLLVNILYIVGIENGNLTLVSFEEGDRSIMGRLSIALEPILAGWFGVPKETILPLVTAFLRKDLAVAQLSAIPMSMYQLFTSVVLISIYFPCIATFAVLWKELGFRGLLKSIAILIISTFTFGGLLHGLWMLMGVA